jgi:hypothetical protein
MELDNLTKEELIDLLINKPKTSESQLRAVNKYRLNNLDKVKETQQKYYEKNKEKIIERSKLAMKSKLADPNIRLNYNLKQVEKRKKNKQIGDLLYSV